MARVLTIDDSPTIRALQRYALEREGHVFEEVADGRAGLEAITSSPYRLIVLLNGSLPIMDGGEVLDALLANRRLERQHVYIPCSANEQFLRRAVERLGARYVAAIPKPFKAQALVEAVTTATRRLEETA